MTSAFHHGAVAGHADDAADVCKQAGERRARDMRRGESLFPWLTGGRLLPERADSPCPGAADAVDVDAPEIDGMASGGSYQVPIGHPHCGPFEPHCDGLICRL